MQKPKLFLILFFVFNIGFFLYNLRNSKQSNKTETEKNNNQTVSQNNDNQDNIKINFSDNNFSFESQKYIPPNFKDYFPEDINGAKKLNILFSSKDKDSFNDKEILDTVRAGLKKTQHHKTSILSWIGNKYIWGKNPQNKYAIEIMYQACGTDDHNLRHYAIYMGLSVTSNKTPNIFRALVDSCMKSQDWNDVGRAIWGCKEDKYKLLPYLESYLNSDNNDEKEVAIAFKNEINGVEDFRVWQGRKIKNDATIKYKEILPKLKNDFINGDLHKIATVIEYFKKNRDILTQMDDSYLEGWEKCINHPNVNIRRETARIVGGYWIWSAKKQSQKAIDIILKLSNDTDVGVVGNAVYHGLSTIRNKNDKIIRQLLNIAKRYYSNDKYHNDMFYHNNYKRCFWGLRDKKYECSILLEKEIQNNSTNPDLWYPAYGVYKDFIGGEPNILTEKQKQYIKNKKI